MRVVIFNVNSHWPSMDRKEKKKFYTQHVIHMQKGGGGVGVGERKGKERSKIKGFFVTWEKLVKINFDRPLGQVILEASLTGFSFFILPSLSVSFSLSLSFSLCLLSLISYKSMPCSEAFFPSWHSLWVKSNIRREISWHFSPSCEEGKGNNK